MPIEYISKDLNPSLLEYSVYKIVRDALKKILFEVKHNGSSKIHAPGNKPDIEAFTKDIHINIEVTKLLGATQAKSEATPISEHMVDTKNKNSNKKVYCIFVSPITADRSIHHFEAYNNKYKAGEDMKIIFMNFNIFNLFFEALVDNPSIFFTLHDFIKLFNKWESFENDNNVLEYLNLNYLKKSEIDKTLKII